MFVQFLTRDLDFNARVFPQCTVQVYAVIALHMEIISDYYPALHQNAVFPPAVAAVITVIPGYIAADLAAGEPRIELDINAVFACHHYPAADFFRDIAADLAALHE